MVKKSMLIVSITLIACLCYGQIKIVVLGSSTAWGSGASTQDSAWAYRYKNYLKSLNPQNELINLALGGYTTYHILPDDITTPGNRPNPDPNRNISKALSLDPDAIIINLPSNDAANLYSIEEQMSNYSIVYDRTGAAGVPLWVATTQPRNMAYAYQLLLVRMRDSTYAMFGEKAINFWTELAVNFASINDLYDSGDGIHLNNAGHKLLYERVVAKNIPEMLGSESPDASPDGIVIYTNPDGTTLTLQSLRNDLKAASLQMYDLHGKLIHSEKLTGTSLKLLTLNIADYPRGLYILHIKANNYQYSKMFLKK